MTATVKNVIMILNHGGNLTTVINYLYTLGFEDREVVEFLKKNFRCSEDGVKFELRTRFGIEL